MRATEVPVHAWVVEREAVRVARVQVTRVKQQAVSGRGVRRRPIIGPGDRRTRRHRHTKDTRIELEIRNGDFRYGPCGGRDLGCWCWWRGNGPERAVEREHPQLIAAWKVELEIAPSCHCHVLLTIDVVRGGRRIHPKTSLELPQPIACFGVV